MSADLRVAASEYLEQRRARGYKLRDEGALVIGFVESLHARGVERITVADALAFAQQRTDVSLATHAGRLGVIRTFTAWLRAVEPAVAEPIPEGLIRGRLPAGQPLSVHTGPGRPAHGHRPAPPRALSG